MQEAVRLSDSHIRNGWRGYTSATDVHRVMEGRSRWNVDLHTETSRGLQGAGH
jgi:hypothetical protein